MVGVRVLVGILLSLAVVSSAFAATSVRENSTNVLTITTNNLERLRVDGSGNIGIGNTSPGAKMQLSAGDSSHILIGPNSAYGTFLRLGYASPPPTNTAQVGVTNGNLHLDSAPGAYTTYINYYNGTGGTVFGNGLGGVSGASVSSAGVVTATSVTTANDAAGQITVGRTDNVNEGGQIMITGAGSYDTWTIDSYQNMLRSFTSSANTDTFAITNYGAGAANLVVEGSVTAASFSGAGTSLTGTAASLTAGAASALAADGTNCGVGQYAQGVDTAGNAQGCAAPTVSTANACNGDGTCEVQAIAQSNAASDLMIYTTGGGIYSTRNTAGDLWTVSMGNGGTATGYFRAQYGGSWNNNALYLYHDGSNGGIATGAGGIALLPANGVTGFGGSGSNAEGWGEVIDMYDANHARLSVRANTIDSRLFSHTGTYGGMTGGGAVGTTSSHPFGIMTANTNRMYFDTNGYVGINTASPAVRLDISGANVAYGGQLRLQSNDYAQMSFYNSGAATLGSANRKADIYFDMGNSDFVIENWNGGSYGDLVLNPGGGNVGITNSAPAQKLDVGGNISLPGSSGYSIWTWSPSDTNWRIGMSAADSTVGFARALATSHVQYATFASGAGQGFAVGDKTTGLSSFEVTGSGSSYKAYFRGNVGMGTGSPSGHLDIQNNPGNNVYDGLVITQNWDNSHTIQTYIDTGAGGGYGQWTYAGGCCNPLLLQPYGGTVGIRTNAPAYTLDVNGSIGAASVTTTTTYATNLQGPNYMTILTNTADDTSYEWVGWYSGSTRAAIFLWDGSWNGCDGGKFCIFGESHQLRLQSLTGDVLMADQMDMSSNKIVNLATPTNTGDAATKGYVDTYAYIVAPQMGTCEWNSYEQSWSYNYPSEWCPSGWTAQTSWTSGGASGSTSCSVWRMTLCRKN